MRLTGSKFREATIPHAGWEMLVMRAVFAWLMWTMLPGDVPYASQPVPNGLGWVFDLTWLANPDLFGLLRIGYGVALVAFALGVVPLLSLGYAVGLITAVGALENSQGAIGHHLQLVCLVGAAMWISSLVSSRADVRQVLRPSLATNQTAVHWSKMIIVASYVTSACVKLIASGGAWIVQLPDISLQLIKTHANVFYDTLIPQSGWAATQLPYLIAEHPNLTRLFFTPGLIFELGALAALWGRRSALVVGGGLLLMHLLVRWVMNLSFSAHEWLLVIFLINLPYWVWLGLRSILDKKSA